MKKGSGGASWGLLIFLLVLVSALWFYPRATREMLSLFLDWGKNITGFVVGTFR